MQKKASWFQLFVIGALVLIVDIATKMLTVKAFPFPPGHGRSEASPLRILDDFFGIDLALTHATNEGAAWGMFAQFSTALVVVRFVLISALIGYLFFFNKRSSWKIPLVLIISGAIGNVVDYFIYGYVVDMIHFRFWGYDYPVFNIADSAIFVGSVWIVFSAFFEKPTAE